MSIEPNTEIPVTAQGLNQFQDVLENLRLSLQDLAEDYPDLAGYQAADTHLKGLSGALAALEKGLIKTGEVARESIEGKVSRIGEAVAELVADLCRFHGLNDVEVKLTIEV